MSKPIKAVDFIIAADFLLGNAREASYNAAARGCIRQAQYSLEDALEYESPISNLGRLSRISDFKDRIAKIMEDPKARSKFKNEAHPSLVRRKKYYPSSQERKAGKCRKH